MMAARFLPVRSLLTVAAAVPLWWTAAARSAEPASPILTASRFLGPEGEELGAERFAEAISRAGMPAKAATGKWTTWRQPPADGVPWLCWVTAGYGESAHAYAFWFDAAGAAYRFAHVPYGKTMTEAGTRVWLAPVDSMADVVAHDSPGQKISGPAVRIRVVREQAASEAPAVVDSEVYEAIAWAAACEAGWTPTASTAPAEATLAVASGVKSASLRLAIETDGRRREIIKRSVHENDIHKVMRRMFSCCAPGSLAADFFRIGSGGVILATAPGRLVCLAEERLRGLDTGTFRACWEADEASRKLLRGAAFVPRHTADGGLSLLQWRPKTIAQIGLADGRPKPLAPVAAADRWSFDLDGSRVVVASGTAVTLFKESREDWRHDEAEAITCGPIFVGRSVVAGTDEGHLFALDRETGELAWRQRLDRGLVGRPAVAGGKAVGGVVVVYCREGDTLVAVDAASGRKAWSQPLGDVPIGPAVGMPSGLLVATKSNRVVLLDPETGRPRAERMLSGWIIDVVPLPGKDGRPAETIAVLTRNGTLTLLAAADLQPKGNHRLDGRPGYGREAGFIVAKNFPTSWPGPLGSGSEKDELDAELEGSMADLADCLLADDEDGYAWIIPLSRLEEKP